MRIFLIFLIFLFYSGSVNAQGHGAYCNHSESTADTQACLKRHLDSAQKRLNEIYDQLDKSLSEEKRTELKELQQTWLRYRDSECMWESTQTETAPLKRINEISCMARLTDDRADILTVVYDDTSTVGGRKEFGSFPRWMNVVSTDHPQVAWQYGQRESFDLNCDSENDEVITGYFTKAVESEEVLENSYFTKNIALAIVKNPVTGRPQSQLLTFEVNQEKAPNHICNDHISIAVAEEKSSAEDDDTEEKTKEKACNVYLKVEAKGCEPKKIYWTGKSYEIAIEDAAEDDVNEKK
jgi:uncharacterized protein YecT (DUF1311 family)